MPLTSKMPSSLSPSIPVPVSKPASAKKPMMPTRSSVAPKM
jgi:hypothetical protein